MSEWSHLPNAHHIDWVLKSVKENDQLWVAGRYRAFDAAVWSARREAIQAARNAGRYDTLDATMGVARGRGSSKARDVMWSPLLALVAYDDCDQYLKMGYEKLQVYAALSEKPQAILLLPMVGIQEKLYQNALKYNCII